MSCREYAYKKGLKPKLIREKWSGPWRIQKARGPVNYRIVMGKQRKLVHHNRLKPYVVRDKELRLPESDDEAEELVEEEIPADQARPVLLYEQAVEEAREEEEPAREEEEPDIRQDQVAPEPIMGHAGQGWCNINPANVLEGGRRRH